MKKKAHEKGKVQAAKLIRVAVVTNHKLRFHWYPAEEVQGWFK